MHLTFLEKTLRYNSLIYIIKLNQLRHGKNDFTYVFYSSLNIFGDSDIFSEYPKNIWSFTFILKINPTIIFLFSLKSLHEKQENFFGRLYDTYGNVWISPLFISNNTPYFERSYFSPSIFGYLKALKCWTTAYKIKCV